MNRPWRDIVDVPDLDWPDQDERFNVNTEVRKNNSTPLAPPPEAAPSLYSEYSRKMSHEAQSIGTPPKPKAGRPRKIYI